MCSHNISLKQYLCRYLISCFLSKLSALTFYCLELSGTLWCKFNKKMNSLDWCKHLAWLLLLICYIKHHKNVSADWMIISRSCAVFFTNLVSQARILPSRSCLVVNCCRLNAGIDFSAGPTCLAIHTMYLAVATPSVKHTPLVPEPFTL